MMKCDPSWFICTSLQNRGRRRSWTSRSCLLHMRQDGEEEEREDLKMSKSNGNTNIVNRLNAILDRPFFDPDEQASDEPKLLSIFRDEFEKDPVHTTTLFGVHHLLACCECFSS